MIVAPFAGAWIEIAKIKKDLRTVLVAPFAGAWIEMQKQIKGRKPLMSLPSRERGLKLYHKPPYLLAVDSRSLRGSVD